nr:RNA-directed DNA polymerase, eukaryota [Tanacetum cinerariifolium]
MEALRRSFNFLKRVIDVGRFKGIQLNKEICLSHLFYADDAVFVGQWSDGNINTLMHVLDCFHYVSGLKINMSKSKIMGLGGAMSRVQAWKEIVDKVKSRLSKWKLKTLSIGGRLTLLKSVLGSIPIFHMSIFRVPSKVLQVLKSIRGQFFNGHDMGSNKATWVKWNSVLTDKNHGGLGVSSLYALNRGLMLKWGGIEEEQLNILSEIVRSINLVSMYDRWVWSLENTGEFKVASTRKLIDEAERLPDGGTLTLKR